MPRHQSAMEFIFDLALGELLAEADEGKDFDSQGPQVVAKDGRLDDRKEKAEVFGLVDDLAARGRFALEMEDVDVEVVQLHFESRAAGHMNILDGGETNRRRLGHVGPFIGHRLEVDAGLFQFHVVKLYRLRGLRCQENACEIGSTGSTFLPI